MELRHLRYFLAVAERLRMEQSPLSQVVKDLESASFFL